MRFHDVLVGRVSREEMLLEEVDVILFGKDDGVGDWFEGDVRYWR